MNKQANKVSWFELPADDLDRATAFYSRVFGWETPPMGDGARFALTVKADEFGNPTEIGGINGGFHQRQSDADVGAVISIYVDDIDDKLDAIQSAGGNVIQPKTQVPEYNLSMAIFRDTEGNTVGIYKVEMV